MTITETPVIEHLTIEVQPSGATTWTSLDARATAATIRRGGERDGVADTIRVGTLAVTLVGELAIGYDLTLRPNVTIRVRSRKTQRPLFTGKIVDVSQRIEFDKGTGERTTFTSVTAADAVQSLANTTRYGAVTDEGFGYESWRSRIARLSRSALVPTAPPPTSSTPIPQRIYTGTVKYPTDWSARYGAEDETEFLLYLRRPGSATTTSIAAGAGVYTLPLRGLIPGRVYTVQVSILARQATLSTTGITSWRVDVAGRATGVRFTANANVPTPSPLLEFVASAPTHTLSFVNVNAISPQQHAAFELRFNALALREVSGADDYQLCDTVLESSLANHFDVACSTVGALWFVDAYGVVQFRRGSEIARPVRFSDAESTTDGTLGYVELVPTFDTRASANTLEITNHGRAEDADNPGTFHAADVTSLHTDEVSIARWGARSAALDMCLYSLDEHSSALERRTREIFEDSAHPKYAYDALTFNAQQDTETATNLELYTPVTVTFDGVEQRARVLALEHRLTPNRWMVGLTFTDVSVGITFDDVRAEFDGRVKNMLENGSFENGQVGWPSVARGVSVIELGDAATGRKFLRFTTNGVQGGSYIQSSYAPVMQGEPYSLGASIRSPHALPMRLDFVWRLANNTYVSTLGQPRAASDDWSRFDYTAVPPATAISVAARILVMPPNPSGNVFDIDAVMLNPGEPAPYLPPGAFTFGALNDLVAGRSFGALNLALTQGVI